MIRRFNYTGRKRIARAHVTVRRSEASPVRMTADWTLATYGFPADARVLVEAQMPGSTERRRVDFGQVGLPAVPSGRPFEDAELAAAYFDFLVVVPDGSGRLLGACRRIYADDVTARQAPLLPVKQEDLGEEVWRLEYGVDGIDGRPLLLVNQRIEGVHERVRADPLFACLVFPEVVRRVLTTIVIDHGLHEIDDEDTRACALWLKWAASLHAEPIPRADRGDTAEARGWVEEVVAAFCRDQRTRERAALVWSEAER